MRKLLTILFFVLLTNLVAAQSKTINVTTAGTLSTLLTVSEKSTVTNLTVTGIIDARDFATMRDAMPKLYSIDISAVTVQAYTGNSGTNTNANSYPSNEIPQYFSQNLSTGTIFQTLKFLTLPNSITSIGEYAFYCCFGLTSITIPNAVTFIASNAFNGCIGLTSLIIPNSVTTIGYQAFQFCRGLTSLTIGSGVSSIADHAFEDCMNIMIIKSLNPNPPTLGTDSVFSVNPKIYVPVGTVDAYKSAPVWGSFTYIQEDILSITTMLAGLSGSSVQFVASIDVIGDTPVKSYGFCWNTTGSPTITDSLVNNGATSILGKFSNTISGLSPVTKYYVKAYATDGQRTVYGNEMTFTTASLPSPAGAIMGAAIVCQGQNTVTYTVPTITNAATYIWTLPTGATGTSTTNSITVNYAKTFTAGSITVKGHSSWGDGSASTLGITANLLPVNAGTITGNTSVCQGETAVTYSVPAIDNALIYTWTLPAGATGTSSTNTITVNYSNSALSGNITVKGHNDCGDGVVSSLGITVNQLPAITTRDTTGICGSNLPLFVFTNYTGTGKLKYKWTPSTGLDNDTIAFPACKVTSNIVYTVTVTTPAGCTVSKNVTVRVLPMAPPEIGIVGISSSNKNVIVWNKPVSTGIESYYIYKETNISNVYEKIGTVPYDSLSIFVDTLSSPNVKSSKYEMSILDRNGLESALSQPHKTMHLSISKGMNNTWNLIWEPYLGFNVSTYSIYKGTNAGSLNYLDATSGSSSQYTDTSVSSGDVYYQLEVTSPTLISPTKAPASIQKVEVSEGSLNSILGSYNSSRSNIATSMINGINNIDGENNKIKLYPNPVLNELKIEFEGGTTFEILNIMGQVVYNGNLMDSNIVQTSNLTSGIYLIKFKTGKSFEYMKIIKE